MVEYLDLLDEMSFFNPNENDYKITRILEEVITENDILCELYESQRLLIEQDTMIFTKLNYGFVNEGVGENIKKAIIAVARKIKELFLKFFSFITGKRKSQKENEAKNKENTQNVDKNVKDIKEKVDNIERKAKEAKQKAPKKKGDFDDFHEMSMKAIALKNEKICTGVHINNSGLSNLIITSTKYDDILEDMIDTIEEMLDEMKKPGALEDLEKHATDEEMMANANAIDPETKQMQKEIYGMVQEWERINTEFLGILPEKYSMEEYNKRFNNDMARFCSNEYGKTHETLVNKLQLADKKITPVLNELERIIKKYENHPNRIINKLLNNVYKDTSLMLKALNCRMNYLIKVQKINDIYIRNAELIAQRTEEVDRLEKQAFELFKKEMTE